MAQPDVWVLGGYQSDFARNLHREGKDFADLAREVVEGTLGGHPVGASGVRMLLDASKQVSGTAGEYQVEGIDTAATLNFGGSTATTVSFVVTAG